jgi:regulator of protease activity HflC (stomatin/prohibitin superfamily)
MSEVRRRAQDAVEELTQDGEIEDFSVNEADFLSVRERGGASGTRIEQATSKLSEASEIANRSFPERGSSGQMTNVVYPVVIPERQSLFWRVLPIGLLIVFAVIAVFSLGLGAIPGIGGLALAVAGPHLWILFALLALFGWWRQSVVMVPDGCQALITRFGRLEDTVGAGRILLFNPWKQVGYLVNTVREYPYNAPIREAPTSGRVNASVDLFLQFRIEQPSEFVFTLGGVKGFSDKLENAISEVTRALIYEQRAEDIYDLVGEDTDKFVGSLNDQFLPAVRFTNANITHAEPSSKEYRIDLASPEMVRVAKEAYTYQYELSLRKEQDEGELNKELAELRKNLSEITADIAAYQAQMDTARERETNNAEARARQRLVEAESEANANAALLEAQALDIRAVSSAGAPEILEYRFQRQVLDRLESVADRLPRVVQLGNQDGDGDVDFLQIARRMIGTGGDSLYSEDDMESLRGRLGEIQSRIDERQGEIDSLSTARTANGEDGSSTYNTNKATVEDEEDRVAEIRRSVTDEAVKERVERIGDGDGSSDNGSENGSESSEKEDG